MCSKILRACLSLITWHVNGENSVNVADRVTRFTPHWLASLWFSSTSKEKIHRLVCHPSWSWAEDSSLLCLWIAYCLLLVRHSHTQKAQIGIPEASLTFSDYSNLIVLLITPSRPDLPRDDSPNWRVLLAPFISTFCTISQHSKCPGNTERKLLTTIPQCSSPSGPWAHFLTSKSCVCFQNRELNELCAPQLVPGRTLQ